MTVARWVRRLGALVVLGWFLHGTDDDWFPED
jgi:hypothetical protein